MLSTADGLVPAGKDAAMAEQGWARARPLVLLRTETRRETSEGGRRLLNVVVAVIGLVLALPLMALIALAIKLTSRGPVFYTQTRVGVDRRQAGGGNWRRRIDYGGRLFTIYKFRTMHESHDRQAQETWATPEDPRVTRIGKVLRKYRLDELPQLINVLRGEMNVVGPRPEQPRIFMSLREQVDRYAVRQRVLPGITGWAQVNQSYDQCLDDVRRKVHLDLEYLHRASALEDLRILLKTLPVVLSKKGAW